MKKLFVRPYRIRDELVMRRAMPTTSFGNPCHTI